MRRLNHGVGEDKWLSGQERLLLLQRARVAFPVTTSSYSQLPAISVPGNPTPSLASSGTCAHVSLHELL